MMFPFRSIRTLDGKALKPYSFAAELFHNFRSDTWVQFSPKSLMPLSQSGFVPVQAIRQKCRNPYLYISGEVFYHIRVFPAAYRAPGCPEFEQDIFFTQFARKADWLAVYIGQGKIYRF